MKILIVDDRDDNLYLLESLLKGFEYTVITARDGQQAIERLREEPVDLIISDILMPVMDGFQLCKECKTDPVLASIPFIFYTATYCDIKDREFGLSLGASRFLVKPMDPSEFLDEITAVLRNHEQGLLSSGNIEADKKNEKLYYKQYNERLIKKLEKKMLELENEVNDRKRTEEALRESEKKFRTIFDNATDGILLADPVTKCFFTGNETICQMLGYSIAEIQNLGIMEIHPKDDISYVLEQFGKQAREEITLARNIPVKRKDGSIFFADINSNPITLKGRTYIMGIFRDITEQKQAEENLREREETLRSIVETSRDWIWAIDLNGNHTYSNPAVKDILGYEPEELIGNSSLRLMHVEDVRSIEQKLPKWTAQKTGWQNLVIRWKHEDGSLRYLESNSVPIFTHDGEIIGFRGVDRDITDRKRYEEEKRSMEAQLRQSQKLESIGTLAGGVAHEINNPIQGIMGYADIIQSRAGEKEDLQMFIDGIRKESQRIATIVKNLLSFARQDSQNHSPARIQDIIGSSLNLLGAVFRKHQITVETNIPEDLPKVKCRSQQIEQVVINLLTNARDALNQKYKGWHENKLIKIEVEPFKRDEIEWVRISVEDKGTGISPEIRDRIFDPFFSMKERADGTGLGLSVSYGIVKDHNGDLYVESEPGEWTRFHVEIPVDSFGGTASDTM